MIPQALDVARPGFWCCVSESSWRRHIGEMKTWEKGKRGRTGRASRSVPQLPLRLLILLATVWTNKRFETASLSRQPVLLRSMVQWAQAWVDCISTNQRVVKRPRGCRMVCWRSGRTAPILMVRLWVFRFILIYFGFCRSVAVLDQGSRQRGCLQWHETCVPKREMARLLCTEEGLILPLGQALLSMNHG